MAWQQIKRIGLLLSLKRHNIYNAPNISKCPQQFSLKSNYQCQINSVFFVFFYIISNQLPHPPKPSSVSSWCLQILHFGKRLTLQWEKRLFFID